MLTNGGGSNGDGGVKEPRGEFTVVLGPCADVGSEEGGVEAAARAMAVLEARWVMWLDGGDTGYCKWW